MCSSVTIAGGLIDLQQLVHAAVVERLQVFFPSLIIRTAVLDPECFLLENSVLKVGAMPYIEPYFINDRHKNRNNQQQV